jgi:sodium-dependent phosphate cotransporter
MTGELGQEGDANEVAETGKDGRPSLGRGLLHTLLVFFLLYVFLLSISMIGASFKLFGKGFAEQLIATCSSPLIGLFIGILATSLLQSSSTTTSLAVGFVGGGVLPLEFAIPVIMGANIGTTVTNSLVSFGFVARREDFRRAFAGATVHDFFNLCSVVVLLPIEMNFHVIQRIAEWLTNGFVSAGGVTFTGPIAAGVKPIVKVIIHFFTDTLGVAPLPAGLILIGCSAATLVASLVFLVKFLRKVLLRSAEGVINRWLFRNDACALGLGIVLTVAMQSSSVTTSLIVPLVGAGVISLARCYPFTMGANVGTTCTALLASLATVKTGEAGAVGVTAAFAHLVFNLLGILIFYPLKRIPIFLAQRLADLAAESKRWAVLFVVGVFYGFPMLIILLFRVLR